MRFEVDDALRSDFSLFNGEKSLCVSTDTKDRKLKKQLEQLFGQVCRTLKCYVSTDLGQRHFCSRPYLLIAN